MTGLAGRIGAVLLLLAGALAVPGPSAVADVPPLRILAIGDSLTATGQWQAETSRLLAAAGVPHQFATVTALGSRCGYWPDKISALLVQHQPDLVIFNCGTNDDPAERMSWGESRTGWALRVVVETTRAYRPTAPARTLPVLVQYSDPLSSPGWLLANEAATNDALWSNESLYLTSGHLAGIANLQPVPGTADYTVDDGVHHTDRGYRTVGRVVYDAARAVMGWPAAIDPPLCGQYGHRPGTARPAYIPCP